MNLFPSTPPTTDHFQLRIQFVSTRLFIFLLATSLTIITIYVSAINVIKTVTFDAPSVTKYYELYEDHPQTLTCPCSRISMPYSSFFRVNYILHPVCQSIYVSKEFIEYMYVATPYYQSSAELLTNGFAVFQTLSSLCHVAEETITINLQHFFSRHYISTTTVTSSLLQNQFKEIFEQFITSITQSLLTSLKSIRATTQINGLMTAKFTNYDLGVWNSGRGLGRMQMTYDDNCSCAESSSCVTPAVMYAYYPEESRWVVPGFFCGCFVLEALLQSSLECFFDQACLHTFHQYVNVPSIFSSTPLLNGRSMTRFAPTTTVRTILESLVVDQWNWSVIYSDYYGACLVSECTYTLVGKHDVIYILSTLIGLVGGLVTTLKFLTPRTVSLVSRIWHKRRRRNIVAVHVTITHHH